MLKYSIFVIITCSFCLLSGFGLKNEEDNIQKWMKDQYSLWIESVDLLIEKIEHKDDSASLKIQYFKVQNQFRKIQFLLEYISEETVKRYFNGSPLYSIEKNIPTVNLLEPEGLQVLDENFFSSNTNFKESLETAKRLRHLIETNKNLFLSVKLNEYDLHKAMFKAVIGIYTLQVTGFDTPSSKSGLSNAIYSLEGMASFLNIHFKNDNHIKFLGNEFVKSAKFIKSNNDFISFDRVCFYKNNILPILRILKSWSEGFSNYSIAMGDLQGVNFQSEGLFNTDFYHIDYFAQLPLSIIKDKKIIGLGKELFFDSILSNDGKMSCATCHQPEKMFTDGLKKSISNIDGIFGNRNTPTLINAIFTRGFFYDLRENSPSRQIVHVVKDKHEFNSDFMDIIDRLEQNKYYKESFKQAFPNMKISKYSITSAITAYISSLTSFDSTFDRYMRGEIENIDSSIIRGFNLFAGKAACATCHFIPTFSGLLPASYKESESEVLGVPYIWNASGNMTLDIDEGRRNSGKPDDESAHFKYSFKTTTLRNISKTQPYMHNGAFLSLEDVMQFYNKGGGKGLGFDLQHQTLSSAALDLTVNEISDIIIFMKSLDSVPTGH
jgi:cytochrome c peroxidase